VTREATTQPEVDPFTEATGQVANALKILLDADEPRRALTADEMRDLFFSLTTALVQLKKLPGGAEAHARVYEECRAELRRRGRADIIREVEGPR
jgi:hypothetical protein